jgi:predicted nuclease with TOPRIM domain
MTPYISLTSLLVSADDPSSTGVIGFVLAGVAALVAVYAFMQTGGLQKRAAELQKKLDEVERDRKKTDSKEREQHKKADARAEELKEMKVELAAQKKKLHASQEEVKQLRDQLKAQAEERDQLLAEKPAFEPLVVVKPPRVERLVEEKIITIEKEDTARVEKLEHNRSELRQELEAEREKHKTARTSLKKLERYTESLRRVAVVSKSKVELLEDKLSHLGRQYYEAVSELAALKGEVAPPAPRPEVREVHAQALDEQMDKAAQEAGVHSD